MASDAKVLPNRDSFALIDTGVELGNAVGEATRSLTQSPGSTKPISVAKGALSLPLSAVLMPLALVITTLTS